MENKNKAFSSYWGLVMCVHDMQKLGNRWFALARWFRGGFNNNNNNNNSSSRLERHQEAVPLENPVGLFDCQRHRSSPIWNRHKNTKYRTLWGNILAKKPKYRYMYFKIHVSVHVQETSWSLTIDGAVWLSLHILSRSNSAFQFNSVSARRGSA